MKTLILLAAVLTPLPAVAQSVPTVAKPIATAAFLEGPAVDAAGTLYFTDLQNGKIMTLAPNGQPVVWRANSNYANGLAIDDDGRILAAEDGDPASGTAPRITRTDPRTGKVEVLADAFAGKGFNAPNDVVVDGQGRIFFTDWARPDFLPPAPVMPRNPFGVYRIDRDGSLHQVLVAPQVEAPNGVMVSPDDRTLYLVESNRAKGGKRRIVSYPIAADGSLGAAHLFHEFSPGRSSDGMAVDVQGRLWAVAGLNAPRAGGETMDTKAGVYIFRPDGALAGFVPIPEDLATNVAFGGPGRRTAYVTAGKTVFTIDSDVAGTRR